MPETFIRGIWSFVEPLKRKFAQRGAGGEIQKSEGDLDLREGDSKRFVACLKFGLRPLGEDAGGIDKEVQGRCCKGKGLADQGETELAGGAFCGAAVELALTTGASHGSSV